MAYCDAVSANLVLDQVRECRVLRTPTITGASLTDTASAVLENWEDYNAYTEAQVRFLRERPDSERALSDWISELENRAKQLEARLEKQEKELRRKGVECFVGSVITAAPFLIPGMPPDFGAHLRSLIGAKSLYDAYQWIGQWRELRKEVVPGTPWSVWKPKGG